MDKVGSGGLDSPARSLSLQERGLAEPEDRHTHTRGGNASVVELQLPDLSRPSMAYCERSRVLPYCGYLTVWPLNRSIERSFVSDSFEHIVVTDL